MDEITIEETTAIIKNQIRQWQMTAKDLEIAIRVHKRIGSDMVDALVNKLAQSEKAIDELNLILNEIG